MNDRFLDMTWREAWQTMVGIAQAALEQTGHSFVAPPTLGRSVVWQVEKDGERRSIAVRTSRDRWFAFARTEAGGWKTLDDNDLVAVVTVDDPAQPVEAEVYLFEAAEVRQHFDQLYAARIAAGHKGADNFPNWIALDHYDEAQGASYAGSGLAELHEPIAVAPLLDDIAEPDTGEFDAMDEGAFEEDAMVEGEADALDPYGQETIGAAIEEMRLRVAALAGVSEDAVRIEVHIG